jgi:hypothetical protein
MLSAGEFTHAPIATYEASAELTFTLQSAPQVCPRPSGVLIVGGASDVLSAWIEICQTYCEGETVFHPATA